jgi:NCS1 family nucleobase:cation symporter-1
MTSLWLPKWINARRGAYMCCIISIAATTWNIQYRASSSSAFLDGYTLCLQLNAGITMSDFWVQEHLSPSLLYKHPEVWGYFHAFNSRAFVAVVCGIGPKFAGLAKATGIKDIPKGATYVYNLGCLVGEDRGFCDFHDCGHDLACGEEVPGGKVMDGLHASGFSHSDQDKMERQPQNTARISRCALLGNRT